MPRIRNSVLSLFNFNLHSRCTRCCCCVRSVQCLIKTLFAASIRSRYDHSIVLSILHFVRNVFNLALHSNVVFHYGYPEGNNHRFEIRNRRMVIGRLSLVYHQCCQNDRTPNTKVTSLSTTYPVNIARAHLRRLI